MKNLGNKGGQYSLLQCKDKLAFMGKRHREGGHCPLNLGQLPTNRDEWARKTARRRPSGG
jgi:hypothetical protein